MTQNINTIHTGMTDINHPERHEEESGGGIIQAMKRDDARRELLASHTHTYK